jgi:hypothetical protein
VNPTQIPALAEIGPKLSIDSSNESKVSFHSSDPFVYAYQLRKILYDRKSNTATTEPYNRHTSLSDTQQPRKIVDIESFEEGPWKREELSVEGVDWYDVGAEDLGNVAAEESCLDVDGSSCSVVLPAPSSKGLEASI